MQSTDKKFLRRKRHSLGRVTRLEDAVAARRQAEARVDEYLEAYLSGDPVPAVNFDL